MDTIEFNNGHLALSILPRCGGKIRSLRSLDSGREWLWHHPHLPLREPVYGENFIEKLDTGGWDEVFPSVSPCGDIPDHGDLAQLPWQVDAAEQDRVSMSVTGRCFPFRFERTTALDGPLIRCAYRLENTGDEPFPWLWCAHPLLPFTEGFSLEVDPAARFEVPFALGDVAALEGGRIAWSDLPEPGHGRWAAKLFSSRGEVNAVTARQTDGAGLRFEWNASEVPYLGLWVNHGAWSGCGSEPYFNIGIEPAMLPVDDLSTAVDPPVLGPGRMVEWSLNVSLF